jgi:hypothetical protein
MEDVEQLQVALWGGCRTTSDPTLSTAAEMAALVRGLALSC